MPIAYVYDIVIESSTDVRVTASGALEALEREVVRRGLAGIGLHVFGHNAGARALYEKLGFVTTNVNLFKPLDRAG